jgi:uncharacterized membrane protein YadS
MSLQRAHGVLIAIAISLCAGFAVRDVAMGNVHAGALLRVAASLTVAIVLGLYLRWFVRHRRRTAAVLHGASRRDN